MAFPPEKLSQREVEVLVWVSKGMTNKQIGFELECSEQTVKNHITAILWKLGAANRAQAAVIGIKKGVI